MYLAVFLTRFRGFVHFKVDFMAWSLKPALRAFRGTKKPAEGEDREGGEGGKDAEAAEGEEGAAKNKENDPNNRQHPHGERPQPAAVARGPHWTV